MNIKQLSDLGNPIAQRVMDAFNSDQPRDERGRWGEAHTADEHDSLANEHRKEEHVATGKAWEFHFRAARMHEKASEAKRSKLVRRFDFPRLSRLANLLTQEAINAKG